MPQENPSAESRKRSEMKVPQKVVFLAIDEARQTKDGHAMVSGMVELTSRDGKKFKQPFNAFDEDTKNGKKITAASDILHKFKAGDAGYVKGVFADDRVRGENGELLPKKNERGFALRRLTVRFADTEKEHEEFRAAARSAKQNAGEAR